MTTYSEVVLAESLAGCGSIVGTILNGWLVQAFGPRKVLLCTLGVMTCFLFIVFFAPSKEVLLAGEILLGLEWGIVSYIFLFGRRLWTLTDAKCSSQPRRRHMPPKCFHCNFVSTQRRTRTCALYLVNLSPPASCVALSTDRTSGDTEFRSPSNGSGRRSSSRLSSLPPSHLIILSGKTNLRRRRGRSEDCRLLDQDWTPRKHWHKSCIPTIWRSNSALALR